MLSRPAFALLILACAVSRAFGGHEAMLGDVFLKLPEPPGFCQLTWAHEIESFFAARAGEQLKKAGRRLLAMYGDCSQIEEMRAYRRRFFDDAIQYQVVLAGMEKPPAESIAQSCTTLRSHANAERDLNGRLAELTATIKVDENRILGVVAEDKNACYAASLYKNRIAADTERTQATMFAVTIVNDRSIIVAYFSVYRNPDTIKVMLEKLRASVAALIAENP
jgi:hypothetical protein